MVETEPDDSSDKESEIEYDDESSSDDDSFDFDIHEGDFVVVKVAGKSRIVHYIAQCPRRTDNQETEGAAVCDIERDARLEPVEHSGRSTSAHGCHQNV